MRPISSTTASSRRRDGARLRMAALTAGDFDGARKKFEEVLAILPGDARAARDAARAAQAAGELQYQRGDMLDAYRGLYHKGVAS